MFSNPFVKRELIDKNPVLKSSIEFSLQLVEYSIGANAKVLNAILSTAKNMNHTFAYFFGEGIITSSNYHVINLKICSKKY